MTESNPEPLFCHAVPGFITLLGFKFMFSYGGPINFYLKASGLQAVGFLDIDAGWKARIIGLLVNAWISIPTSMLLATGILSCMETIIGKNGLIYWKYDLAFSLATIVIGAILMFCSFDQVTTVRMLGTVMVYLGALGAVENRSGK